MKKGLILVSGVMLGLFIIVFSFTRPALFDFWNFSETGQIGDTIGGITAPIIGLLSAFLIYYSFNVQNEANKLQREALNNEILRNKENEEFQLLLSLFKEIKEEVDNFKFYVYDPSRIVSSNLTTSGSSIEYKGLSAIAELINANQSSFRSGSDNQRSSGIDQINYILGSIVDLIERVNISFLKKAIKNY